jgi:DNA processing protein
VPQARHFPRRNRLISGMSLGVLVVEAAPRSGSLITARLALDQGREVFAVPGSPLDPRARGCNDLLRQGAGLVETADDVVQALSGMIEPLPAPPEPPDFLAEARPTAPEGEVADGRATIEELLGPVPVAVDELVRQCHLSPAVVNMVLLELELAGRAERHPGNRISLTAAGEAEPS